MAFKVACAQIAPAKGNIPKNLDTLADAILQAQGEGVDLVLFPETSTSGYFLEGGVIEAALTVEQLAKELTQRIGNRITAPIDVVVGFYEQANGNLYNSAAYIAFGEHGPRVVGTYKKFFLPTYGVFDEERFVSRGHDLGVFDTRLGRVAILLCEDIWHSFLPSLCAVRGAQLILVPSASPARGFGGPYIENLDRYKRLMTAVSEEHGVYCANCQLCGFEGGKGFVGGSMVVDPLGRLVVQAPINEPHLLIAEIDLDLVTIARAQSPLISDLQAAWQDIRRLVAEAEA
jgi:N-carbamoylputrescine amidase